MEVVIAEARLNASDTSVVFEMSLSSSASSLSGSQQKPSLELSKMLVFRVLNKLMGLLARP